MGKLLELELPIIWELIVQDEAACSPILVSGQVMPEASMCVCVLSGLQAWGQAMVGG